MKKIFNVFNVGTVLSLRLKYRPYVSAIALTGAVSFSACSSGDEIVNNPNFNPADNTVKTEFAISLPQSLTPATRQTEAIVQGQTTPIFRGMTNIRLLPFAEFVPSTNPNVSPLQDKQYNLANIDAFDNNGNQNAKIYNDLAIPVGTGAFILYGLAKTDQDDESDFHNGKVIAPSTYVQSASDYEFGLSPIYTANEANERANELVKYVKNIRDCRNNITNHTLHSYLTAFQPTAGSSASILAAVQDLWKKAIAISGIDNTELSTLRNAIMSIGSVNYASIDESDNVSFINEKVQNYPANIKLPDGAASIDWSDADNPAVIINNTGNAAIAPLNSYVYPPALCYRANTNIGVSDIANVSSTYGSSTWTDIVTGKYSRGKVTGTTQSIALLNQVNYAVGRLDLKIKCASGTLYDASGAGVTVASEGFPVSAILIGNQRNVDYQFKPRDSSPIYTVYDPDMNGTVVAKANSFEGVSHTLVFETSESLKQVNVMVEMTNNTGQDFRGKDGIVPAGGKFYLTGILDLTKSAEMSGTPQSSIFLQDYVTTVELTITQGTLGQQNSSGLGAAYNVIPDLKTPQLEVAFSVNLHWNLGITFSKVI